MSDEPYTKRVAMIFLKKYHLDEDYKSEYLDWAAKIRSERIFEDVEDVSLNNFTFASSSSPPAFLYALIDIIFITM